MLGTLIAEVSGSDVEGFTFGIARGRLALAQLGDEGLERLPSGVGDVRLGAGREMQVNLTCAGRLEHPLVIAGFVGLVAHGSYNDCGQFFDTCNPYTCTLHSCMQIGCNPLVARPRSIDTDCCIGAIGRGF